jgi:hypothetical protein
MLTQETRQFNKNNSYNQTLKICIFCQFAMKDRVPGTETVKYKNKHKDEK